MFLNERQSKTRIGRTSGFRRLVYLQPLHIMDGRARLKGISGFFLFPDTAAPDVYSLQRVIVQWNQGSIVLYNMWRLRV